MIVSEQGTVNYLAVEVKKNCLWQVLFWTKNYALIVERIPIFPIVELWQ